MRAERFLFHRTFLLKSWLRYGSPIFPEAIVIETSTKCNRSCYYCPNSIKPAVEQTYMPDSVFSKVIERMLEMKWKGAVFFHFFNEPMLDPSIYDKIAAVRKRFPKNRLQLFTNGDYLTHDSIVFLIKSGISRITIAEHLPFNESWRKKAREFERLYPKHVYLRDPIESDPSKGVGLVTNPGTGVRGQKRCIVVRCSYVIQHNGDVALCNFDWHRQYNQGNIMESSLLDIWRNSKVLDIREGAANGKPVIEFCKKCMAIG
jgi:radical SAM protein with 4Fe4S-binding SPASM domain